MKGLFDHLRTNKLSTEIDNRRETGEKNIFNTT